MKTCSLFDKYHSEAASSNNQRADEAHQFAKYDVEYYKADKTGQECPGCIVDKLSSYTHELQRLLKSLEDGVPIDFRHKRNLKTMPPENRRT